MKTGFLNFALMMISFVALFGMLELYVRLVADDGMQFDLEMWKYATLMKTTAETRRVGHRHIPNTTAHLMGVDVSVNSKGLRDFEYGDDKPKNVTRILMLGDSVTFGCANWLCFLAAMFTLRQLLWAYSWVACRLVGILPVVSATPSKGP